ncbi:MAG: hypothetical protein ACYTBP_16740, partial [Planctomycetota bacterium]
FFTAKRQRKANHCSLQRRNDSSLRNKTSFTTETRRAQRKAKLIHHESTNDTKKSNSLSKIKSKKQFTAEYVEDAENNVLKDKTISPQRHRGRGERQFLLE